LTAARADHGRRSEVAGALLGGGGATIPPSRPRRRTGLALVTLLLLAALVGGTVLRQLPGDAPEQAGWTPTAPAELAATEDPLQRKVREELRVFTDWLAEYDVEGYIGEVGWPEDADRERWNRLAEVWLADAEAADLWVTVWSAGEWWGEDYPLAPYVSSGGTGPVDTSRLHGELLTWHARNRSLTLGANVSGAEFAAPGGTDTTSEFSNRRPGRHGREYHYDGQATFDYLASRDMQLVRLPFRWERIQPQLGEDLDPMELARLTAAVGRAEAAGLDVVLDVHNYGAYFLDDGDGGVRHAIGSSEVTRWHFADLWRRLSLAMHDVPGVIGYGLMNEPVNLAEAYGETPAQVWERASQDAVDAIRETGDRTLVMVGGYQWSHARHWREVHPHPWITDPADNVRYEAHHYWQQSYDRSYDTEVAEAAALERQAETASG
jgi:hypothetical protein